MQVPEEKARWIQMTFRDVGISDILTAAGVPAVLLFGLPDAKDDRGTSASSAHGVVQRAVKALKASHPGLVVITDVCVCAYTSHGHCGVIRDGQVDIEALQRQVEFQIEGDIGHGGSFRLSRAQATRRLPSQCASR